MTRAARLPLVRSTVVATDPTPLSSRQIAALGSAVTQQLGGGQLRVAGEVARWQERAQEIPDPVLRRDALMSLREKRSYVNGAALFATLAVGDRTGVVPRVLVTFQVMANFLDTVSERTAVADGPQSGRLMRAFVDATDLCVPVCTDYYAEQAHADDGGYLAELVGACRRDCAALPHYPAARELLVREAARARALEIAHDPDEARRDGRLRAFAVGEGAAADELEWFEFAAGAASAMTVIVLLALAGRPLDPRVSPADTVRELAAVASAYRWTAALSTILDSYVDREEDLASGDWSMVGYYPSTAAGLARIATVTERSLRELRALRSGERHAVIVASMIAMFLSRDSARTPQLRSSSDELARAAGTLTRVLVPVLRLWRTAYRLRSL